MAKMVAVLAVLVVAVAFSFAVGAGSRASAGFAEAMVAHNVYFALNENTPENRQKLVDACFKYLVDHPGVSYFAAGTLCEDLARPVNDREWDVGLHIVFATKADHDKYQDAPTHIQFIEENKSLWKKVRVFDSYVKSATPKK